MRKKETAALKHNYFIVLKKIFNRKSTQFGPIIKTQSQLRGFSYGNNCNRSSIYYSMYSSYLTVWSFIHTGSQFFLVGKFIPAIFLLNPNCANLEANFSRGFFSKWKKTEISVAYFRGFNPLLISLFSAVLWKKIQISVPIFLGQFCLKSGLIYPKMWSFLACVDEALYNECRKGKEWNPVT